MASAYFFKGEAFDTLYQKNRFEIKTKVVEDLMKKIFLYGKKCSRQFL